MTVRTALAEWLSPKTFADQRAYERMKAEVIDAYHWLNGYPDAADTLRWILDNDHNRRRSVGDPALGSLPSGIDRFREMLERRRLGSAA